jgi:hypothetical protein
LHGISFDVEKGFISAYFFNNMYEKKEEAMGRTKWRLLFPDVLIRVLGEQET